MNLQTIELLTKQQSPWVIVDDDQSIPLTGNILISPSRFNTLDKSRKGQVGLVINTDADVESLNGIVSTISFLAIHFPVFADGRGFTLARLIRERYGYTENLIACGYFLPDQIHYLARCGFNSFILPDTETVETARSCLQPFSEAYQTSYDRKEPLFRRT